jgi:hypothetical protein
MKKIRLFICLLCGFCIGIFNSVVGQTAIIKGSVFEQGATKIERIPLPGATVLVNGSGIGTVTDAEGNFEMSVSQNYPVTVIVSYIGYKADTTIIEIRILSKYIWQDQSSSMKSLLKADKMQP